MGWPVCRGRRCWVQGLAPRGHGWRQKPAHLRTRQMRARHEWERGAVLREE